MTEKHSGHPLGDPQSNHPLTDAPAQSAEDKPKGIQIPIPMAADIPLVSYTLIIVNVAIFVMRYIWPELAYDIILWGYTDPQAVIQNGEVYRLFTSMFLHFNEAHILFNAIAIYYIGTNLERLFGHLRVVLIYVLGGLAGSVLPLFFMSGGLGASGAVFALWGAEAVFLYQHLNIFGTTGRQRLQNSLMLMVVNFLAGFSVNALANLDDNAVRIGNAAHFGGLVGGAILSWLIAPHFVVRRKTGYLEGELPVEIAQTRDLRDSIRPLLFFAFGLLALLLMAIVLRT